MELIVRGMTCGHCEAAVRHAVLRVAPEAEVSIDRARNRVSVAGEIDADHVESAIRTEGYDVARGI